MAKLLDRLGIEEGQTRLTPRAWAALVVVALIAMLPGFFSLPPIDRDESRYAQASRQMMETGDYIDIQFQDQNRYVKPVGIYWMQVITATPMGGADAPIWAHRLPSLLATLFVICLTAWFGTRIRGPSFGLAAGLLLAFSLSVGVDARMAKTDAALMAATALSMVALWFVMSSEEKGIPFKGWPLVFWAATGLGLLIKGPIILIVSIPAIIAFALWRRDWSFLRRLHILPGIAVMLAVFLPWFIAIMVTTGGEFWQDSVGHALMGKVAKGDDSHGAPPGYHTLAALMTFWPGAILLALAAFAAWRRRGETVMRFLIAWFLPFWIIYELVATKLPHYTLPVFPALALIAAFGLVDGAGILKRNEAARIAHGIVVALFCLVTFVLGIVPFILAGEMQSDAPAIAWLGVVAALGIIVFGLAFAMRPGLDRFVPMGALCLVLYIILFGLALPSMDRFWLSDRLKQQIVGLGGCETPALATIDYREPSLVFNFGTDTLLGDTQSVLAKLSADPQCAITAIGQGEVGGFAAAAADADVPLKLLGEVRGYNYTKGRDITLTIISHQDSDYLLPESATAQ